MRNKYSAHIGIERLYSEENCSHRETGTVPSASHPTTMNEYIDIDVIPPINVFWSQATD